VLANSISIYPNPAKDELRIKSEELRINNVEICDVAGRVVVASLTVAQMQNAQRAEASSAPTGTATLNVSALPQGIYLLKIYTDRGILVERFVKN